MTVRSLPRLGGLLQLVDVNFEMPCPNERVKVSKNLQQTFQSKDPISGCFQVPTVSVMLAGGQVSSSGRIIYRQHLDSEHCTDIVNRPALLELARLKH